MARAEVGMIVEELESWVSFRTEGFLPLDSDPHGGLLVGDSTSVWVDDREGAGMVDRVGWLGWEGPRRFSSESTTSLNFEYIVSLEEGMLRTVFVRFWQPTFEASGSVFKVLLIELPVRD